MKNPKKKTGGFTLVEILICLAITAVVGIFLAGFLGPQLNIYHSIDSAADAKGVCNTVFNLVQDHIRGGKDFSFEGDTLTYTMVTVSGDAETKTLTSASFDGEVAAEYRGGRIRITYDLSLVSTGNVGVTIAVLRSAGSNEILYSSTQEVLCRNAALTAA